MADVPELRGLTISFYRAADMNVDCTLGGISARFTKAVVVGTVNHTGQFRNTPIIRDLPRACRVFEPRDDCPAVWLVCGKNGPRDRFIIPSSLRTDCVVPDLDRWLMFGGNLAFSSDSRWMDLVDHQYGVRVHDRHEH